jgi:hypothetical protein
MEGVDVGLTFSAHVHHGGRQLSVRNVVPTLTSSKRQVSYGPPWAHYLSGYQDRLLGGPLGLPGLRYMAPDGVEHKDYGGEVLS